MYRYLYTYIYMFIQIAPIVGPYHFLLFKWNCLDTVSQASLATFVCVFFLNILSWLLYGWKGDQKVWFVVFLDSCKKGAQYGAWHGMWNIVLVFSLMEGATYYSLSAWISWAILGYRFFKKKPGVMGPGPRLSNWCECISVAVISSWFVDDKKLQWSSNRWFISNLTPFLKK